MAREEARLFATIWDDPDWRGMSVDAQWLYTALLSQRALSMCGVQPLMPRRWAKLAAGMTVARVTKALAELVERRFVVTDTDTEEVWIRTFLRHDRVLETPGSTMAMMRAFPGVLSGPIRDGILDGLGGEFLDGLPGRFPRAFGDGRQYQIPEPFRDAYQRRFAVGPPDPSPNGLAGARASTPDSGLLTPDSGAADPADPLPATTEPDLANAILRAWYDEHDGPKPAQPWPAMLAVVRKMLKAGHPPGAVAWALRDAPVVSVGSLTLSLNRHAQRTKPQVGASIHAIARARERAG